MRARKRARERGRTSVLDRSLWPGRLELLDLSLELAEVDSLVASDLELVREGKVVEAVDPRELLDDVGPEQVEAVRGKAAGGSETASSGVRAWVGDAPEEERRGKALLGANVDKVGEDLLGHHFLARLGRGQDRILEELVALAERDRVVPLLVFVVQQDGQPAELKQLMLLEPAGERHRVEVGELGMGGGRGRQRKRAGRR